LFERLNRLLSLDQERLQFAVYKIRMLEEAAQHFDSRVSGFCPAGLSKLLDQLNRLHLSILFREWPEEARGLNPEYSESV
jgi:hypothetical protein